MSCTLVCLLLQVSPPQEDVQGNQWWTRYQPVSYKLTSRSGTEQEFAQMVETCKNHGIRIIVDAVINHMANQPGGTGRGGTNFDKKCNYPGLYGCQDFHHYDVPCGGRWVRSTWVHGTRTAAIGKGCMHCSYHCMSWLLFWPTGVGGLA